MKCPSCKCTSFVTDSRDAGGTTRRRRQCRICKHRWSTWEVTEAEFRALQALEHIAETIDQARPALDVTNDNNPAHSKNTTANRDQGVTMAEREQTKRPFLISTK